MTDRFKIWHIANVDYDELDLHNGESKVFEQEYPTLAEASAVVKALAAYDRYLDSRADMPLVESNVQGLMCWHGGEWIDREEENGEWVCQEYCNCGYGNPHSVCDPGHQ